MSDQVKISRVEVQIGDHQEMLTIEQAKSLRDQLNDLFGTKVEEHHHHHGGGCRSYVTWPSLQDDYQRYRDSLPKVWCHSNKDGEYTATVKC